MIISNVYKFIEEKYSPILGYLAVSPIEEFKQFFISINNKAGIMRDFFGFEYEDDETVTFFDFTGDSEKSINIELSDLIIILQPLICDYVKVYPIEGLEIENLINDIQNS